MKKQGSEVTQKYKYLRDRDLVEEFVFSDPQGDKTIEELKRRGIEESAKKIYSICMDAFYEACWDYGIY